MLLNDVAYFYGVMFGDGFIGRNKDNSVYFMLKTIDKDFVEFWRNCGERLYGKAYSVYTQKPERPNRNIAYVSKIYGGDKVKDFLQSTKDRTEIPNFIFDGDEVCKKSFIQGLMDSEGYVTLSLSPVKQSHIGLYFSCTSKWTKDFWYIIKNLGIEVSDLYIRKMKDGRKDVYNFKINILDYVNSGLSFNILRKKRRLEFITKILNDYTHNYKGENYTQPNRRYSLNSIEK